MLPILFHWQYKFANKAVTINNSILQARKWLLVKIHFSYFFVNAKPIRILSSHKDIFSVPSPGTFIWFLPFSVSRGTDFWGTDNRAVVSCVEEGHSSCFHFPRVQAWGPGVASGTLAGSASLPITRASPLFPRGCWWKRPQGCDRQTGCFSFHAGSGERITQVMAPSAVHCPYGRAP